MAKVKFAEGVTPPVGKRFGFTFMPNHYGQSVLYHEKNDRCRYPAQKFRNANMDRTIRNWRNQTAGTISSWETFITTYPQLCKNGIDNLSAYQLWLKRNYYLLLNYGNNTPFMISPSLTEVTNDPVTFELKLEAGRLKLYYTFQNNTSDLIASVFLSNRNYESHYFNRFQSRYMGYILNNAVKEIVYGILYNWYAATYSTGGASIAPAGWHLPSYTEIRTLLATLNNGVDDFAQVQQQGGKLKEILYEHWNSPNTGADNSSGFTARGSGMRVSSTGLFQCIKTDFRSWIINRSDGGVLDLNSSNINSIWVFSAYSYKTGFSIRLLCDSSTDPGSLTDYDGNIYPTVKIGNQVWMARNLSVKHFNDGTEIPWHGANPANFFTNSEWANLSTPGLCYYNNDESNALINTAQPIDISELFINRFGMMPQPGQWLYLHIVPMGLNNAQFFAPVSQKIQVQ